MSIQKCEQCNSEFRWKEIYSSIFLAYKPIICNNCSTKHEIAFSSRFIVVIFTIFPIFLFQFIYSDRLDMPIYFSICLVIAMALVISLFLPFLVKYTKEAKTK
ncbi:TIGR04104 family putative zinc finger protein [Bacillus sp. 31A1R]|uniref:TIGR04104 family putative zinc finger protein n=1 Tax=Robertmurraya mangrovi TaxID=3098077 RepID=A0ABU5IWH8_9BACI|nr:TIGR04104 family putative zinc finger protein [Bacillus sp. 31A1R]MDZ5471509.1 TIGR04104 family putative zinc finger protein [Bacillus sp. 31A1R]